MDRRSFIALGATAGALAGVAPAAASTRQSAASTRRPAAADLLWAADFSTATDSYGAGFGNVQVQYGGGDIENDGPGIPVVDHPKLGRALKISLAENQERWEAAPGAADDIGEGDEYYFRVDFALDPSFPVDQGNSFCLVNQIHDSGTGSPPIEFDIFESKLAVRGAGDGYSRDLSPVAVDTVYKMIYRVKFSSDPSNTLLEVWLNDKQVLTGFQPPIDLLAGGGSYWKGATMYCDPSIPPLTVFQNAHRVGTTYASVTD